MTLTLLDIYNECAGQPWSMYDNDANSVEDFESALKISINKAASFLWNLRPWKFRIDEFGFHTFEDQNVYESPNGLIYHKTIGDKKRFFIKCDGEFLTYAEDYEFLEPAKGTPTHFYVEGEKLYLYPTPDKDYEISIRYLLLPYAVNENNEFVNTMKEDKDRINIPERYEILFSNCLISLAMIYAIADESDENHSGYLKQYQDALLSLSEYCNNNLADKNIII